MKNERAILEVFNDFIKEDPKRAEEMGLTASDGFKNYAAELFLYGYKTAQLQEKVDLIEIIVSYILSTQAGSHKRKMAIRIMKQFAKANDIEIKYIIDTINELEE